MSSSRTLMKMMTQVVCFLTVACLLLFCVPSCGLNVACFYTSWAQYRVGEAKFTVSNINASLCTHINYGFANLVGNNIVQYEYNDQDMWKQLNDLKQINPGLKTFLSVGGASLSGQFPNMVSSKDNRNAFINSAISTLRDNGFDGLDIDWEYPVATDKQNLRILTQEMVSAFVMEGQNTNRPRLMLSFSVPAGISTIDNGYDIIGMNSYVTFWNVMGYDYHGSWERTVNLPTPLNDQGDGLSVSSTVDHYVALGASLEKLILGLAFYARTWAVSESSSSIGSPATGGGAAGAFTKTPGVLAYYEVCDFIRTSGMIPQYESTYGYLNYGAKNGLWIGYEALNSLEEKMKFIERKSLGGAMIWTLDFDDFSGRFCGQGTFPLTKLVSSRMLSIATNVSTTTTTTTTTTSNTTSANTTTTNTTPTTATATSTSTTTATSASTTTATSTPTTTATSTSTSTVSSSPNSTVCRTKYGFFPDNGDCSYYLVCENGTVTRRIRCVNNTIFNPNTKACENLANTTFTCPNQTSATTTTATTTARATTVSTTAPTTTASTTAPTTTASTTAPTTTSSTAAPTTTSSTTAPTTTSSTTAPTTTSSTTAPTTTVLTSTAAVTPKSQNDTDNPCNFTCPSKFGTYANTDCTVYNVCNRWKVSCIRCPSGQIYNPKNNKCELVSTSTYKCPN